MSKKVSLGVAATVTLIAMAVTFSMTMTVSMNMFNNTVSSVKNKERMYNKLSEVDRYVRANEYFDINDDTLNDTIASGYMLGISDGYARYYSAKAYSERVGLANGRLMGIGVSVVKDPSSGYARIIRVYDNTPATNVGLEVGGFITAIGDTSTRSMSDTATMTSALLGEEGSTVNINYVSGSTKVIQNMAMPKRALQPGSRVLIVDDVMKGGGTAKGMIALAHEVGAQVVGKAFLIATAAPERKLVEDYTAFFTLHNVDEEQQKVTLEVNK